MNDRYATAHLAEFLAEVRASQRPVCRGIAGNP